MKRLHIAVAGIVLIGVLAIVTVASGIGGVTAAEDDRFRIKGTTLTKYLGTDTFVSIPDTITSIGDEAFSGNEIITSIEIPSSVEQISYNAFKNCTALTSVILPDSIEKVGPGAFEGCTALTSVQIGENVSSWGSGVFANCDSLAKVTIDGDNEYLTYYNGAIYNGNMTMLYQVLPAREGENYVMPETVENIDTYAFWNLQNTKNVKISSKVSGIPRQAMSSMGSVENVVIQEPTTGIGERAIANNTNLKQVVIPDSVVSIDKKAFSGTSEFQICTSKSSTADTFGKDHDIEVIYKADEYPDDFMDSNAGMEQKPNVGDSTDSNETEDSQTTAATDETDTASDDENSGSQNDTDNKNENNTTQQKPSEFESTAKYIHPLDVPEKDNVLGKTVIVAGKAVVLMDNHKGQVYGIPGGIEPDLVEEGQETDTGTNSAPDKTENSISVSYELNKDDSIAQRKFYKQKDLTETQIEENIKTIGRLAYAESGLKSVVIPENVTEIEYGAFMSCANLKDVTIPDTVSAIGTKAFEGTPWLKDWRDGASDSEDGDFLIVGDGILLAYRGSAEHVEIPDSVKQIGSEVFKGHKEILDVAIPVSVEKICAEAFRNCSSLTGLTGCEGLKTVVRGAFYGTQISEDDFKK